MFQSILLIRWGPREGAGHTHKGPREAAGHTHKARGGVPGRAAGHTHKARGGQQAHPQPLTFQIPFQHCVQDEGQC